MGDAAVESFEVVTDDEVGRKCGKDELSRVETGCLLERRSDSRVARRTVQMMNQARSLYSVNITCSKLPPTLLPKARILDIQPIFLQIIPNNFLFSLIFFFLSNQSFLFSFNCNYLPKLYLLIVNNYSLCKRTTAQDRQENQNPRFVYFL